MKDFSQYRHRRSIRLKGYDYSAEGMYFITLNTHKRQRAFGFIENAVMHLNETGTVAQSCWLDIPVHYPNVVLHDFVIMPDHIHGIIELIKTQSIDQSVVAVVGAQDFDESIVGAQNLDESVVGAQNLEPRQLHQKQQIEKRKRHEYQKIIPRSVGSIIRGYKIGVTKWYRENELGTQIWQRNYYEHIIRDEKSFQRISHYILDNPRKWVN